MRLPTPALVGLLLLAIAVLVGLGIWQLQRNEWKQDLIAESYARTDAPVVDVRDGQSFAPDEVEYYRVVIEGDWRLEDTFFLANRARTSVRGEEIVVPVQPAAGPAILVNMGWIPDGARDEAMRDLERMQGQPASGLALDGTGRSGRQIPSGGWSALAPAPMADTLGYPVTDWFVIAGEERERPPLPGEALPVQGWQRLHDTTPHLEYALTWFGIAAALVVIAVARLVVMPARERQTGAAGGKPLDARPDRPDAAG